MKLILIVFALALIFINLILVKDKKRDESKVNFEEILLNKKETITDYEVEIGKLRKDLSETIIDLQREIYNLKDEINILKKENKVLNNEKNNIEDLHINKIVEDFEKSKDNNLDENIKGNKSLMVAKLLGEKKSDEEICNFLKIGKGELQLIKGLYKY